VVENFVAAAGGVPLLRVAELRAGLVAVRFLRAAIPVSSRTAADGMSRIRSRSIGTLDGALLSTGMPGSLKTRYLPSTGCYGTTIPRSPRRS